MPFCSLGKIWVCHLLFSTALAWCTQVSPARAEPTETTRALSEALFQEGKRLLDQGRAEEACPKLVESQRLDPGGGTQLLIGLCYEKAGKLASAWVELGEALALAKRDGRESRAEVAREHLAAIEPRLSRIQFELSDAAHVEGLKIFHQGTEIPSAAWSVALPYDEGPHEFILRAPGREEAKVSTLVEGEGKLLTLELPVLAKQPAPGPAPAAGAAETDEGQPPPSLPSAPENEAKKPATRRVIAIGALGAGAVAAGVGSYLGLRAMSLQKETKAACPDTVCPEVGLQEDYEAAGRAARHSNIAFAVSGALVVGGIVALLIPSRTTEETGSVRTGLQVASLPKGVALGWKGKF